MNPDQQPAPEIDEAAAVAAVQREEEERARRLGLVRVPQIGGKIGTRWMDRIGAKVEGDSAQATAIRLAQQDARLAARAAEERRGARRAVLVGGGLLLAMAAGTVAALDYTGVYRVGLFPEPAPAPVATPQPQIEPAPAAARAAPPPAIAAEPAAAPPPPPEVAAQEQLAAPAPQPVAASLPAAVDTPEIARLRQAAADKRAWVQRCQYEADAETERWKASARAMWGVVPNPITVIPDRSSWRRPCAILRLEDSQRLRGSTPGEMAEIANAKSGYANVSRQMGEHVEMIRTWHYRRAQAERDAAAAEARLQQALEQPR